MRGQAFVAGAIAAIAVAACGGSSGNPSPGTSATPDNPEITIGISQPVAQLEVPMLAAQRGDFARAGLTNVSVKLIPSAQLLPAVAAGTVQFAVSSAPQLDEAALKAPVKLIAMWAAHSNIQFIAAPGIHSVTDLKGKVLSASSPGTISYVLSHKMLHDAGVSFTDVNYKSIQSAALLAPAFSTGSIDGTISSPPLTSQMLSSRPGASVLRDFTSLDFTGAEVAAYMPWAQQHHGAAVAVLKALNSAVKAWRSDKGAAEQVIASQGTAQALLDPTYQAALGTFTSQVQDVTLVQEKSVLTIAHDAGEQVSSSQASSVIASGFVSAALAKS